MNIWLRKKVPFYARHIRKKLFFRGNILIKYYSVNIFRNNGVDNMTISKYITLINRWSVCGLRGGFSKRNAII